jgi:replicative DNA helicase
MKLSAPVYRLKRKAKLLSRQEKIPLHQALDTIAAQEGYPGGWSLLAAKHSASASSAKLFRRLEPGDLVLVGARPNHGKTLLSLELAAEAVNAGNRAAFFTLEYTAADVEERLDILGAMRDEARSMFQIDCSDAIHAAYIEDRMAATPRGTLIAVDYLQLLDQKRETPELSLQVRSLKEFARHKGLIIVMIAQIDRTYDSAAKSFPSIEDVRLPNRLDLTLFNKACFLQNGEIQFHTIN